MKTTNYDYRPLLRQRLEERCLANPRYSLRAFSRDLGLSPASLSLILRGKKGLSKLKAQAVANHLGLSIDQKLKFIKKVEATDARSKKSRDQALMELETTDPVSDDRAQLRLDNFATISDWHHFAILELTKLKTFKANPRWISNRLGIAEASAQEALLRLLRLGFLKKTKNTLKTVNSSSIVASEVPSEAIQNFNRQILDKAKTSVSMQSLDERELATLTFAINRNSIPKLKEKIRAFSRELNNEIGHEQYLNKPNEVYSLALQLFRLTEKEIK